MVLPEISFRYVSAILLLAVYQTEVIRTLQSIRTAVMTISILFLIVMCFIIVISFGSLVWFVFLICSISTSLADASFYHCSIALANMLYGFLMSVMFFCVPQQN